MMWDMTPEASASALRVAVVPDSFKGSATAAEIAAAMAGGAQQAAWERGRSVRVDQVPFADGGEGTLDAICSAWGISPREAQVGDALGRPIRARYGLSSDGRTGLIEAAEANGLPGVSDVPAQPLRAGTFGVGELAVLLLDAGCEEILLCIGGSATTDGGAGILQALGVHLLDAEGQELGPGGGALADLHRIDVADAHPRARRVRWRIACDVTNPLTGPRGAAAVFGPQKGAGSREIQALDAALDRFAAVLAGHLGRDLSQDSGMGAAGGIPAGLSLFGAELRPGGELVAELLGLQSVLAEADVVLTGEGKLDSQSLHGKVVSTVRALTPERTPVLVLAGAVELGSGQLEEAGITAAAAVSDPAAGRRQMYAQTLPNTEAAARRVLGDLLDAAAEEVRSA